MLERGLLPYASELFGIYQPLLGWKSNQAKRRVSTERCRAMAALLQEIGRDPIFENNPDFLMIDLSETRSSRENCFGTIVAEIMATMVTGHVSSHERELTLEEWQQFYIDHNENNSENLAIWLHQAKKAHFQGDQRPPEALARVRREIVAASTLKWLGTQLNHGAPVDAVNLLNKIFPPSKGNWQLLTHFIDPMADFAKLEVNRLKEQLVGDAVLSPVGLVHLYREYFFEMGSFLGPPVGHVWLSPGGTVELVEVNTRKTVTERSAELSGESIHKSETTRTEQDDLSTAVKEDNSENTKLGAGVSGGVNTGVYQASASASFSQESTRKSSHETTHKQMRQQSEKLSSEIRSNFKTTFRTVTEVTDTSSRRYVVQNTTEELLNYELRRKMREVSVQVQHIGTQLCWQVYLDEMGQSLGLGELVHVATPSDLQSTPPPDRIPYPDPIEKTFTANFLFRTSREEGKASSDSGQDYFDDPRADGQADLGSANTGGDRIYNEQIFEPPVPATGYHLAKTAIRHIETRGAHVSPQAEVLDGNRFLIRLIYANFGSKYEMPLDVTLVWMPNADRSEIDKKNEESLKQFTEEKKRKIHMEYVQAVRERVKLTGLVKRRDSVDLREEERTVVYRELIRQLVRARQDAPTGQGDSGRHVTAELIRSLFDVDKMLYFVAPDWWKPRTRFNNEPASNQATPLTEADVVTWGGYQTNRGERKNYLITEESVPAPLGSSLGWLIQLDGDSHRNAFLNSPWVKAIIPILPGRELAALAWLQLAHVEGADGLDAEYSPQEGDPPKFQTQPPPTIGEALAMLAEDIRELGTSMSSYLKTETVFQNGFDPLVSGFRNDVGAMEVFDKWIGILPTDQVVAVEVEYDPKTGLQK